MLYDFIPCLQKPSRIGKVPSPFTNLFKSQRLTCTSHIKHWLWLSGWDQPIESTDQETGRSGEENVKAFISSPVHESPTKNQLLRNSPFHTLSLSLQSNPQTVSPSPFGCQQSKNLPLLLKLYYTIRLVLPNHSLIYEQTLY